MECLNNITIAHYYFSPILFSPLPLPTPPHPPKKSSDHKLRKGEWNALKDNCDNKVFVYIANTNFIHTY